VAQRLSATVRGADTVARLGGDEFVVLATALENAEDAMVVARKLSEAVSAPVRAPHGDWQVGCSVGLAIYPLDGETAELLIAIADREMYRVKAARHAADKTGRVGEALRA
jgi:diguanylate cyclase (GGDEF)-like protein